MDARLSKTYPVALEKRLSSSPRRVGRRYARVVVFEGISTLPRVPNFCSATSGRVCCCPTDRWQNPGPASGYPRFQTHPPDESGTHQQGPSCDLGTFAAPALRQQVPAPSETVGPLAEDFKEGRAKTSTERKGRSSPALSLRKLRPKEKQKKEALDRL